MRPNCVIYVVTGDKGSGKSTVCARVAREAAESGLIVGGILTQRGDTGDPGSPRRVVDLRSGEGRPFGSQEIERSHHGAQGSGLERQADQTATSDPLTPGWDFDPGVFAWVAEVLSRATPCDLLVIDELGPLELLGGRGWASALGLLRSRDYNVALVVCRRALLEALRERLGPIPTTYLEVTAQVRDDLPAAILARSSKRQEVL